MALSTEAPVADDLATLVALQSANVHVLKRNKTLKRKRLKQEKAFEAQLATFDELYQTDLEQLLKTLDDYNEFCELLGALWFIRAWVPPSVDCSMPFDRGEPRSPRNAD